MKRIHIHVSTNNLENSVNFYSKLFGSEPTKLKDDYAKWMLDDPKLNFAISSGRAQKGLNHLGIQVENANELENMRDQFKKADMLTFDEREITCCYAKSDKTWVEDPNGINWETYITLEDAEIFKNSPAKENECCLPKRKESLSMGCC